ncbi:uncharacterized protein LOC5507853 isoform X5 [Nematostella vectensis]|uniref:uncharacterized protein LOC5507853 isoform X5 n=1 Tax=Nematostella vectensis TaxID=45351 RepID=UPI0020772CAA|nr:uncharacterized protein LOC5507853 isoform X5 [Nematostella vectensis]
MKFAYLLLFAFAAAQAVPSDLDGYLMEDDEDRHPYVQCKIDLYDCFRLKSKTRMGCLTGYKNCMAVLVPTIPPFVIACKDNLKQCVATADGFIAKGKCFIAFAKCLKGNGPSSPVTFMEDDATPPRHPYVQCKIDLYDCFRLKKKSKMECMTGYKNCMAVLVPTIPPFVIACKDQLKTCVLSASGILAKASCFKEFGQCLINKGPSPPAIDTFLMEDEEDSDRHPYVQCKIDLYDCFRLKKKSKMECMTGYKNCMAVLVPTIPPFVIACKDNLKQCVATADGFIAKGKCFIAFAKCLKDGGPSSPVTFMEDDATPPRHPYVQCKIDLYDCFRLKKKSKMECMAGYKNCMAVLVPTIPPFVIACKDQLKTCVSSASGILAKATCFKEFGQCLINKGPSPPAIDTFLMEDEEDSDRHPYVQCKIDLYDCFRLKKKSKMECITGYKNCMAELGPTIPPFVIVCKDELKTCVSSASGILAKATCFKEFGQCLMKGPSPPAVDAGAFVLDALEDGPAPTRHPYIQCKVDLYKCVKNGGDKLQCAKDYKNCMVQHLPTVPPYIVECRGKLKMCLAAAGGWRDQAKCFIDLAKCIRAGANA